MDGGQGGVSPHTLGQDVWKFQLTAQNYSLSRLSKQSALNYSYARIHPWHQATGPDLQVAGPSETLAEVCVGVFSEEHAEFRAEHVLHPRRVFVCSPADSLEQLARMLEDSEKEPVMQDLERKRTEVLPFDKLILLNAREPSAYICTHTIRAPMLK